MNPSRAAVGGLNKEVRPSIDRADLGSYARAPV